MALATEDEGGQKEGKQSKLRQFVFARGKFTFLQPILI
jgi:hypothetical protein